MSEAHVPDKISFQLKPIYSSDTVEYKKGNFLLLKSMTEKI